MPEPLLLFLRELARIVSVCGFRHDDADGVPHAPDHACGWVVEPATSEQLSLIAEMDALPFSHAQGRGVDSKLISIGESPTGALRIGEDVGG